MQFVVVKVGSPGGKQAEFEAAILRSDADHDLAVLKIDAPDDLLTPIKVAFRSLQPVCTLKLGISKFCSSAAEKLFI